MADTDTTAVSSPTSNGAGKVKATGVTERWAVNELGRTGLKHFSGTLFEEFLPQLQGRNAAKVYLEMSLNDPVVAASLFAIEMLMREVPWHVEPASDEEADVEIADFVESCMEDMDHTWADFVAEVLTMLPFGWAYFEQVYKRRSGPQKMPRYSQNELTTATVFSDEASGIPSGVLDTKTRKAGSKHNDSKVGWRRFGIRSQDSLQRWALTRNGDVIGMWQLSPPDYQLTFIPIEKALHFRTTSVKNSPEGRSVLRGAYRPWFFKKRLEEIEAIGLERDLAGLPVAYVPPELLAANRSGDAESAFLAIQDIVRKIKRDEQEGVMFPLAYTADGKERYRLELLSTGGRRQFDTNTIITRYSQQIAMTVLADFILIGHEQVGSFALSSDKTDLFAVALGAWLGAIQDEINRKAVPQLLELNGMLTDTPPKILHGDIETPDLAALSQYVQQLSGAGMPLFPDEVLENHLREAGNLPERPEDFDEQLMEHKREEMEMQQEMMGGQVPGEDDFEEDDNVGPAMNRHRQRGFDEDRREAQAEADKKSSGKKPPAQVAKAILAAAVAKHYGPGSHRSGSPQSVHGSDAPSRGEAEADAWWDDAEPIETVGDYTLYESSFDTGAVGVLGPDFGFIRDRESGMEEWGDLTYELQKHQGPGPHDSGSGQEVHGSGGDTGDSSDTSTSGGTRPTVGAEALRRLTAAEGFSVYEPTGQFLQLGVDDGYMVALEGFEAVTEAPTLEWVKQYRELNGNRLAQPGVRWGGWAEQQPDGTTLFYLDTSLSFNDREAALRAGRDNEQKAIMDLSTGEVIPVGAAATKAAPSRFVYVPLDTAMSDQAAVDAVLEAGQQGFVEKFLDDNFEILQTPEAVVVAKVNDDGTTTLEAVPSRRDMLDQFPDTQVDENVASLQREVGRLRQQGQLVDQTRSMLEALEGEQAEGVRGEYAEAVQQTVDELKELLEEMEGFEQEPQVGKRRWWWPWQAT